MRHTLINNLVIARIDLLSLYVRLLWYHNILKGSIDQKHAKTNEIWRHNSEIHLAFACSRCPPWFPDIYRPYGACLKRGSGKHMFGLSLFRLSRQSNISMSGEERFKYPLPWENKISQMPCPRANKDNQIPTPAGMTLIGALVLTLKGLLYVMVNATFLGQSWARHSHRGTFSNTWLL